jgi:hypothetical protein
MNEIKPSILIESKCRNEYFEINFFKAGLYIPIKKKKEILFLRHCLVENLSRRLTNFT